MMKSLQIKPHFFLNGIIVAFVFGTLFPTFRALIIGTEGATNAFSFLIAVLPDILLSFIFILSFYIRKQSTGVWLFKPGMTDYFILVVFFSNLIIGSIISADIKLIAYGVRLTYLPILFYFVARNMENCWTEIQIQKAVHRLMQWISLTALIGISLYFFFPGIEEKLKTLVHAFRGEYFIPRMNSIYASPTMNGAYMAMAGIYFALLQSYAFDAFGLASISLISSSLLLSVSRGGVIGFLFTWLVSIPWLRKWKKSLIIGFILFGSVFVTCKSVGLSLSNLGWIFQSAAETASMEAKLTRVQLWTKAFHDFKEKPLGYGIGKSGWIAYRFLKGTNEKSAYEATDGWYLKQASETGIWGLLSFLSLFGWFFFRMIRKVRTGSFDLLFFIFMLFVQVLLINIVSNVLDYFTFNSIFWLLMGIGENIVRKRETNQ